MALSAPSSFANETFRAWKALHPYLIISAVRRETRRGAVWSGAYRAATWATAAEFSPPITTSDGSMKSFTAVPSRKNSGFENDVQGIEAGEMRHHDLFAGSRKYRASNGKD